MEVGIQVSSIKPLLKTEEQVFEAFRKMAALGCHIVQLQWIDPAVSMDVISKALLENGMHSVSVQDFYEVIYENPEYYIELNQKTGGIWLCVSRIPERLKSKEGLGQYVQELRDFQKHLDVYEQKLCFHPVSTDYQEIDGIRPVEWMMEQMPELILALDLYHLNRSRKDMPGWIRKYEGRICMVHYKDAVGEQLVPAGQGDTDWTGVTRACVDTQIPYAFAEQERWDRDPYDCLKEAMDWMEIDIANI